MGYECFDISVTDKVAHLKLIRPEKHNSMIPSFWRDLPEIVDSLSSEGAVRALVISAEGKHFCSGMDISVFTGGNLDAPTDGGPDKADSKSGFRSRRNERFRSTAMKLQDTFSCLEQARMPVLCAIQGACVGGGIDMVSAADMRYADESTFFSIAEINIGMTADVGTLQRMPKLVAEGLVRELAFTGRRWSAEEAMAAGFVNKVFPDHESLVSGVLEVATEIATKSPMAVWGTKRAMNFTRDHSVADGLEFIANWNAAMFDTDDMAEAFTAQMEKRPGDYPDLHPLSEGI